MLYIVNRWLIHYTVKTEIQETDRLQRTVARLVATSPAGVNLLLIGGFVPNEDSGLARLFRRTAKAARQADLLRRRAGERSAHLPPCREHRAGSLAAARPNCPLR